MHPSSAHQEGGTAGAAAGGANPTGERRRRRQRKNAPHGWLEPVRLPGVPITDPRWAEARRGHKPPNFGRIFPPDPLTVSEIVALMQQCPINRPSGLRDRALITLLWRSGLRIAEALDLYPRHVDLSNGTVRVECGKGAQPGVSVLDPAGAKMVELWLYKRCELGIPADRALFCTVLQDAHIYGELYRPLGDAYVRNLLKRLAKNACLERRVTPHSFRHTMTDELTDDPEITLRVIQAQLRHKRISSTDAYVRKLGHKELRRRMRDRAWPAEAAHLLLPV